MADRNSFKKITKSTLDAAKILYSSENYNISGYLLGYVIEISLKACICKRLQLSEYPESGIHHDVFSSHDLNRLLVLSGYSEEVNLSLNKDLFNNWSILTKDWKPSARYTENTYNKNNIEEKIKALEDPKHGFFTWIKRKW
jgi:hypothetical protein